MNGYMEHSVELSAEASKHKIEAKTLKIMKDNMVKVTREAVVRTDIADRRAKDVKEALREAMEENSQLLGIQKDLAVEIKELKT